MTIAADRREIVALIDEAMAGGARQAAACAEIGINPRTFQRWKTPDGEVQEDQRPLAERPPPANKLSEMERDLIVTTCNTTEFSSLAPCQIVPQLADRGRYIASESSFYRVLRERGQNSHRGRARRRSHSKPPTSFEAKGPCQVWSWDITWLPGPILGAFFYLYLIVDIYSRKIVGWEVHERESAEFAARLLERAVWSEGCLARPLALHADNGSAMKGATMKTTMERLGVIPSFSRPRVSNDNPFSEALFRTCKYVPTWPTRGFATIEDARVWVLAFVRWYNGEHRHSAIRFVTPEVRHRGADQFLLARRHELYQAARAMNPARWSGRTRNWSPIGSVWLNPERTERPRRTSEEGHGGDDALNQIAGGGAPMAAPKKNAA